VLLELKVKDIGIINEITWRPEVGLNVITGETGAGKSLVVDAIKALLSGQLAGDEIRHGANEAQVEGIFVIPGDSSPGQLREQLVEKGLADEEDTLVLTGDFRRQGRTTSRVNRRAVSREIMQLIGDYLVDIHGQSEHLSLLVREQQLNFLDDYAHTLELRHEFTVTAAKLAQVEREVQALLRDEQESARQVEFLCFQIDEIKQARLEEGEEEELTRERTLLESGEKLKLAAGEVQEFICGEDSTLTPVSALAALNRAVRALRQIAEKDPVMKTQLEFLEGTVYGLTELAGELRAYGESLEYDPERFEAVETRLQLIRDLERKYGKSVAEVLGFLEKSEAELASLADAGGRRAQFEAEVAELREHLGELAGRLSSERSTAAGKLTEAVRSELGDLNMKQIEFEIALTREESETGIPFPDGNRYAFQTHGADNVEFRVSTNPGEPLSPLARIASSGEVSRFMLALKGALAEADRVPVLIFDEIDVGVGGRSGEVIGKKLWRLSRNRQVICVTHLPQIAAFADAHYHVHKQAAGARTLSNIQVLEGEARVSELVSMIAGPDYTAASLRTAREMIDKARNWKNALA
jgi:DNA repair protein RecN (Recombination protein N)